MDQQIEQANGDLDCGYVSCFSKPASCPTAQGHGVRWYVDDLGSGKHSSLKADLYIEEKSGSHQGAESGLDCGVIGRVSPEWPLLKPPIGEANKRRIVELGTSRLVDLDARVVDLDEDYRGCISADRVWRDERKPDLCRKLVLPAQDPSDFAAPLALGSSTSSSSGALAKVNELPPGGSERQKRSQLIRDLQSHVRSTRKLKRSTSVDALHAKEDALTKIFVQIDELDRQVRGPVNETRACTPRARSLSFSSPEEGKKPLVADPVATSHRSPSPECPDKEDSSAATPDDSTCQDDGTVLNADEKQVYPDEGCFGKSCRGSPMHPSKKSVELEDVRASMFPHVPPEKLANETASFSGIVANQSVIEDLRRNSEIRVLIATLVRSTPSKKEDAAKLLGAMACESENLTCMIELGVIPPLVDLLRSCRQGAQEQAARTLRRLAWQNQENKEAITAAGAVAPLVCLLAPGRSLMLRDQACGVLGSLAINSPNTKSLISEAGAAPWIVKLLECGCEDVMEQAARTLWHLVVNHPSNKALMAGADAIPPLVRLLCNGRADVREQARGALSSLSMGSPANKAAVRRAAAFTGCDLEDAGLKQHAEPVYLHVYNVGSDDSVKYVNVLLRPVGAGAFHAGVEVYGQEWSFGHRSSHISGVFCVKPRQCMTHDYRETVDMGFTSLSHTEVLALLSRLADAWPGKDYHFISNNCCHFCNAFCIELGVPPPPEWVTKLAGAGASLLNGYRAVVSHAHSATSPVANRSDNEDQRSIERGILSFASDGAGVVASTLEQIAGDGFTNSLVNALSKTSDRLEILVRNGLYSDVTVDECDVAEVVLECIKAGDGDLSALTFSQKSICLAIEAGSWSIGMRHQPVVFCHLVPNDRARHRLILETHFVISWEAPDLFITKITSRTVLVDGVQVPMPPNKLKLCPNAQIGLCEPAPGPLSSQATAAHNAGSKNSSPFMIFQVRFRDSATSKASREASSLKSVHLPCSATRQPSRPFECSNEQPQWLERPFHRIELGTLDANFGGRTMSTARPPPKKMSTRTPA